jgi:predicted metalloprotease with PDZ domain
VVTSKGAGVRITAFEPGSAAESAGLQVGDIIVGIAKKHFKDASQFLDATAKAAGTPTYEVEFRRNGQSLKLNVESRLRPPVTASVVATPEPAPAVPAPQTITATSVSDELTKLAKLRDQGILTPEEFTLQKKKLLGN